MEFEKLGPRGSGSSPRCGLRHLQDAGCAVRGWGGSGRASTASPQSFPPTARPRPDGSMAPLLLVQAPAFRWFGPLTQPPLLIRGLYSAFS